MKKNRQKIPQVAILLAEGFLNLVLSLWWVRVIGFAGVAYGTLTAALVTSAWAYPILLRRATADRVSAPFKELLRGVLVPLALALAGSLIVRSHMSGMGASSRFFLGSGTSIMIFVCVSCLFSRSILLDMVHFFWHRGGMRAGRTG